MAGVGERRVADVGRLWATGRRRGAAWTTGGGVGWWCAPARERGRRKRKEEREGKGREWEKRGKFFCFNFNFDFFIKKGILGTLGI